MKSEANLIPLFFILSLKPLTSECYPQSEDNIDLFDLKIHDDPNVVSKEIEEIISEDWADTWEPSPEMKQWFPYYISGKDDDGATGNRYSKCISLSFHFIIVRVHSFLLLVFQCL